MAKSETDLLKEHTETWAKDISEQMDSATTWDEVKRLYDEHNAELDNLKELNKYLKRA